MPTPEELRADLAKRASALGFVRVGVARAEPLIEETARLDAWLAAGRHGDMGWMERSRDVRSDVRHRSMLPSAKSVVVLATPYARPSENGAGLSIRIAKYARGRDYHNVLGKRAKKLVRFLRERGFHARASVDSMPVFERAWARRAGIGFIGKNACLIVPGIGSHVFLTTLVTNAELPADAPMRERCGECRRCLDACPTGAFVGPYEVDARRCISYLTIESRRPPDAELAPRMSDWIFGCDECQDVCPFNHGNAAIEVDPAFANGDRWRELDLGSVIELDRETFDRLAHGSPVARARREGLARNAAVALANSHGKRSLPVLHALAAGHDSPLVRETARAAIERLEGAQSESSSSAT
jgi:epoxyqueuosine reductase